jgi:curli biogenesis system outer membrane secretion channel CsgG
VNLRKLLCATWATALILAGASTTAALAQPAPAGLGLKHTVGVDAFGGGELTEGAASPDSLNALLTDSLINDGRFIVVERAGLGGVQGEQQLGQSGAATVGTVAKANQMIGAGLLVRGAVIKFSSAAGGSGLSLGGSLGGGLLGAGGGAKTSKAVMTVSLRLIDTTTGQVLATATGEGSATSKEVNAGLINNRTGATAGANTFKATPVGKAAEIAIDQAVGKLSAGLGNVPWSALVVDDRAGVVYINAGADQNVQPGLTLGAYRKGETLTDPGTGEVLDVQMTKIADIQVDAVREKISTAHIVSGGAPERGDLLKLQ